MKSPQKVTRVQLNFGTDEEYILLGIVSTDPDYKLSLSLNKKLNISLQSYHPVEVVEKNGNKVNFSRFSDNSMAPDRTFQLISNKYHKEYFLKKFHKLDYILHIYSSINEYDKEDIANKVREIDTITAVFIINTLNTSERNLQYLTS